MLERKRFFSIEVFPYASLLLATQFYNKKCVEKLNVISSMRMYHALFGCFSQWSLEDKKCCVLNAGGVWGPLLRTPEKNVFFYGSFPSYCDVELVFF